MSNLNKFLTISKFYFILKSRCIGVIKTQNFVCGVALQEIASKGVTHRIPNQIFDIFLNFLYNLVCFNRFDHLAVVFPGGTFGTINSCSGMPVATRFQLPLKIITFDFQIKDSKTFLSKILLITLAKSI